MPRTTRTVRWVTAAALGGALGFGGAQALAAPSQPECIPGQCNVSCRAQGAARGQCVDGQCACLFITP
jgi:hypothetical protein